MIPRALRVVADEAAGADASMEEALASVAAKVAALRPNVVLIVWEKPDGTTELVTLPASRAVAKGLVLAAYATLFPEDNDA